MEAKDRGVLFLDVKHGRLEKVQKMINSMGLPNLSSWEYGYELLVEAVKNRHESIAEWLLLKNCKVKGGVTIWNTPLLLAVIDGNVNIVRLLLERNAYVEARSRAGITALQVAFFSYGTDEIIKLLLQYGADINADISADISATLLNVNNSIMGEPFTYMGKIRNQENFLFLVDILKLNGITFDKLNMLYLAVLIKEPEWVADILSYGADVNNKQNKAAFFSALYQSGPKIEKIVKLFKCHFSVNSEDVKNVELIFKCIRSDHTDIVKDLLKYGASVELRCEPKYCCKNSCTLFHTAAKYGRFEIIKMLVSQGGDPNVTNEKGIPPVYYALKNEDNETTNLLLSIGTSLKGITRCFYLDYVKEHHMSLHDAISEKDAHLVKHILEKGYDVNVKNRFGKSPLHLVADHRHSSFEEFEILQLLLQYGANVDDIGPNKKTILYTTVKQENYRITSEILKYKPDVNNEINKSAFILAIYNGRTEIVDDFRAHGFHMDHKDIKNARLLHMCVQNGYNEILEELLECGADPNTRCDPVCCHNKGCTLLHTISRLYKFPSRTKDAIKIVLSYGADINMKDFNRVTPLYNTITIQQGEFAELFLTNGADTQDKLSWEILQATIRFRQWQTLKLLINHGADINFMDLNGKTLMCHALDHNVVEIFQLLLNKGINLKKNSMPLLTAAKMGSRELVEKFLKRGARVNFRDTYGTTALHFAVWNNDEDLFRFLLSKGALAFTGMDSRYPLQNVPKAELRKGIYTTPFHIAATDNAKLNILRTLLELNESGVNCRDGRGNTPIHVASGLQQRQVIETLLEYNADIKATNNSRMSAFQSFLTSGNAKLLIGYNYEFQRQYNLKVKNVLNSVHWESMVEIFIKHVIKQDAISVVKTHHVTECVFGMYYLFYTQCQKEIDSMKNEKISEKLTFHNILSKNIKALAVHTRNDKVIAAFKSNIIKEKFPIYADILMKQFDKAEERKELLEIGETLLNSLPIFRLPGLVSQQIFKYLSVTDLKNIISLFQKPENKSHWLNITV